MHLPILMKPPERTSFRQGQPVGLPLKKLKPSPHRTGVHGGIALIGPDGRRLDRLITTQVTFKRLGVDDINWYLASGEWQGKAGGYAIQGLGGGLIRALNGSYTNVVGLSLFDIRNMLDGLGWPVRGGV